MDANVRRPPPPVTTSKSNAYEEMLDVQYAIVAAHIWTLGGVVAEPDEIGMLQFAAVHKGMLALLSAVNLVRDGFFGSARPLLRYVFEIQVLAKFVSTSRDLALAQRWHRGETIYFANAVLKRIVKLDPEPLREFWTVLNQFAHATSRSLQISPLAEDHKDELQFDLAAITLLLDAGFHLLSSHTFTSQMRYYATFYDENGHLRELRARARQLRKEGAKHYADQGRALSRTFRATWGIR